MASTEKYLQYRGNIAAMVALGPKLLLCTLHPEEQPTPLYRIELDKAELDTRPSSGGRALVLDNDELFLLAPDGALLRGSVDAALSPLFCLAGAGAMAPLAQQRFAIAAGQTLVIIDRVKGVELQRFELEAPISALASDSSGVWLVAAREDGVLTVFDREDKDEWTISSTGKVHDGNVFAVCFERDELRVLSSGADSRLLSTHVRGNLEAEDRGGRAMHQGGALAIVLGKDDIFYTLGADSTIKQWSKTGRPLTLTSKDGVGDGVALCVGEYNGRPHLLQACKDNSIRAFILDAEGRMNDRSLVLRGALDWAQHELEAKDPKRREEALRKLAEYNDGGAIALLERAANILPDVALKVLATELLGASGNPRAVSPLEALLSASESAIRMAAFAGLLSRQGPSLRVLELALDVRQEDLGQAAVKQLEALAPKDEQAMMRLVGCLDREPQAVRMAAIDSIALLRPSGAEAELIAIRSTMPDVRVEALRRCLRRELLAEPAVQRALRRYAEDSDAGVRRTAFLVSVLSKPTLAEALRSRDKDLHRGFYELQVGPLESEDKLPKLKKANLQVSDEDRVPLVEAMASHALDTCLAGASGLAMLQDPRALGALLQLSRENQSDARVQTCRALQELGDERALQRLRLMLRDADAGVRDAAFSAVVKLLDAAPLDAAESGLMAEHVDVRRRGLQVLVKLAKKMAEPAGEKTSKRSKKDQQEADPRAWALLERALNDADPGLRSEAFKTVLNQRFRALDADSDGIDQTLRFALCSIHGDLRREVLGEVMGQMSEPWAWPLLLELLNDPDSALRAEAFEFARKKAKSRLLEALRAGLNSRHVDIRIEACRALIERKEEGAQLLLVQALEDEDNTVRQMAVDALATAGLESALQKAMGSRYANVRLRAACARAERGDDAARQPLLDEIAVERPTFEDERKLWEDYVVLALYGLSQLGDPSTLEQLARLCSYPEARIRLAAAHAMAWCAAPQQLTVLREALQHQDAAVKYYAAVGLAFCGDASGASIIASYVENNKRNKQQLRRKDNDVGPDLAFLGMLAALALGEQGRDALLAFLDHPDLDIHRRALLLTLLLELGWARETPQLALAAMSSRHPRTRLSAAWAVECWPERERFAELVTSLVNDRGDTVKPGPLSIDTIQKMAAFLAHDASTARMRVASLLWYLNDFDDENQVVARRWALLARRYESQMASCLSAAKKQAVAPSKELQSLVLGAYIGLLRQGGPESIRVSAIARLGSIAEKMRSEQDSIMLGSVFPSLLMALRDSYANVRKAAFEALLQLSFDRSALAAEALATGINAMGAMGLELLTRDVEQKKAFQVLSRVVLEHTDGLEREAFTQLCKLVDEVEAIEVALEASSSSLQLSALYRLVELAHRDERALASLRKTLQSRFRALRLSAADMLARRQDESAFEPLVALLQSNVRDEQERAATALLALRHPKSAEALLARIENDPAGSASALRLLQLVGDLRNTQAVAPLCAMMLDAKWSKDNRFNATQWKRQCLSAALKACGHDQRILDPQDERPDKTWLEKQSPRDDKALATILETLVKLGDERALLEAIPKARWSQSNAVDAVLAAQVRSSNDALRQAVVEAIAWRARKRGAKLDALYTALGVAESMTQFLAAEGLALTGHAEGVGTLLTAAEMMTDDALRIRAVEALGKLGDARALELLLRHAKDNESALRPAAIEALGHLSKSPKEKEIFTLLEQLVKRDDDEALPEGVRALRYFGSAEAWLLLRQLVAHEDDGVRCAVAEELRYDQDPGSVELLLKLVSEDEDQDTAEKAVESLRARLGDAVEIDYAQLQSMHEFWADDDGELLRRIRERGDAGRLLDLMPKFDEELQTLIGKALLSREPLPVDACAARLDAVSYEVATLSMYVLGRAGEAVAKAHGKAMGAACGTARLGWARELGRAEAGEHHTLAEATKCWSRALWACARCGVAAEELLLVAESNLDAIRGMAAESTKLPERGGARPRAHRKLETSSLVIAAAWRELRTQALLALGTGLGKKKGLEALERSLGDDDAAIRSVAAGVLKTLDAARAAAAVGAALDDAVSLHLLVDPSNAKAKKALAEAAGSTHHQGLALSHLIAAQDVAALTAAAGNRDLVEAARLGAIEALGCVTQGSAQKALLGIATDAKEDEELRKAAWRALRRAKRWAAKSKEARV